MKPSKDIVMCQITLLTVELLQKSLHVETTRTLKSHRSGHEAHVRGRRHSAHNDRLGIEWRPMKRYEISVARQASVARLDQIIGPKT